ncbi:plasmid mobilization relaxosome protein MobC (plasmid) [Clostridium perfringens]
MKKIIVIDGLKEILLELSREGNNLNQIAKKNK